MRHHTAAPLADGSGFHYASVHPRRGGHPLGYCAEHPPHATEAEARECYAQWRRDRLQLDGTCSWTNCSVKDCPKPANQLAEVRGDSMLTAALCPEHLTVEHATAVMQLDRPAGDAWVS